MTITDTVEYGQLKIGHRDESLILSIRPLVNKLSGAVTSAIVGFTAVWLVCLVKLQLIALLIAINDVRINHVCCANRIHAHRNITLQNKSYSY